MPASDLIHHFASVVLDCGVRRGVPGLPPRVLAPGERWTGRDFVNFLREVGTALDDTFFGLASAPCPARCTPFGVELMVLSGTLGDALDRYGRFYALATDGLAIRLSVRGTLAAIELVEADPSLDPSRFLIEWYATRLYGLSQWLIGCEIPQLAVEFAHGRTLPAGAYAEVLGKRVSFNQPADRLVMPRHLLDRRIVRDLDDLSVVTAAEFNPEQRSYLSGSWSRRIRIALRDSLLATTTLPTMEDLARQFGVSSQTLRRGLRAEETSYREIKADARREVVETTISDTSLTLSQISVLAGFAETNGLVRAMKSWTGLSLSAFRRAAIASANDGEAERPARIPSER